MILVAVVLMGAQLGGYYSNRIKSTWIIRSLALALGMVGVRILATSLRFKGF